MKINFLKKEKSFKKYKDSVWSDVNLYWQIALYIILTVLLASLFFGYRIYLSINKEPVFSDAVNNSKIDKIKKDRIEKTLEYFQEREVKSKEIINSPAPIIDPSL